MVTINGEKRDVNGIRLNDYVALIGLKTERIAVEINGIVVPRSEYENTTLKDGDNVEIVSFVGGG